jgi:c-di-GMP-binding flagellar brake protein YcgR
MDTLKKLQNETTYLVIDQAANRFNFCGLVEIDEQVVANSVDGEEYDLDGNLPEDTKRAIETMTENYVDIADFTSVVRFVKKDTTYYYLTF